MNRARNTLMGIEEAAAIVWLVIVLLGFGVSIAPEITGGPVLSSVDRLLPAYVVMAVLALVGLLRGPRTRSLPESCSNAGDPNDA